MSGQLILIVLGKQGAGKGTQSQRLCRLYGLAHVSTGDILRAAVKAGSPLGLEVKSILDKGELVSDDLVNRLVEARLQAEDARRGAVLDGFPRTLGQAEALDAILGEGGVRLVINLDLPDELVVARLSARRVCQECGATYVDTDPSAVSGTCEACGGDVIQRSDDQPEAIRARLAAFERDTRPLLDYYGQRGLLVSVDGDQGIDEVTEELRRVLAEAGVE